MRNSRLRAAWLLALGAPLLFVPGLAAATPPVPAVATTEPAAVRNLRIQMPAGASRHSAQEEANARIVLQWHYEFFDLGQFQSASDKYMAADFQQNDPREPSGRQRYVDNFKTNGYVPKQPAERPPLLAVFTSGDLVMTVIPSQWPKAAGVAAEAGPIHCNMYRVINGRIQAMWVSGEAGGGAAPGAVAAANPPAALTTAGRCDAQCLQAVALDYLARLQRHDASGLKLAANFRATENYRPIKVGEGYWQNVGRIYHQKLFVDAVSGQVAAIGMLDHGGRDAYFALRLKLVDGALSQSEMLLIHNGDATFFEASRDKPIDAIYSETVPVAQRSSREQLIRIADQFTDAWQYRNEDLAPFADIAPVVGKCRFFENNVELTDPKGPAGDTCGGMLEYGGKNGIRGTGKSGNGAGQGGPPAQMSGTRPADWDIGRPPLTGSQMWMRDRRYPIVDVEHGVIYTYHVQGGTQPRPGETIQYERPAGGGAPGMGAGGAAYMVGLVKVINGRIVRVDHFELEAGPNATGGFDD